MQSWDFTKEKAMKPPHRCLKVRKWQESCSTWPESSAGAESLWPGATYCILRMEDVGGRRIVHDDHFAQLPPKATQVFHIVPTMENT